MSLELHPIRWLKVRIALAWVRRFIRRQTPETQAEIMKVLESIWASRAQQARVLMTVLAILPILHLASWVPELEKVQSALNSDDPMKAASAFLGAAFVAYHAIVGIFDRRRQDANHAAMVAAGTAKPDPA